MPKYNVKSGMNTRCIDLNSDKYIDIKMSEVII